MRLARSVCCPGCRRVARDGRGGATKENGQSGCRPRSIVIEVVHCGYMVMWLSPVDLLLGEATFTAGVDELVLAKVGAAEAA